MLQRVRQFAHANRTPTSADYTLARENLSPALFELFAAQHPRDIVHSAATARWLLQRGHTDPDLVAAALVHDVGKGDQRRLDRVAYVLASSAHIASSLAAPRSRFALRRAVARTAAHSESGAARLEAAGATDRVVYLTRLHHVSPPPDPVLALLQQADDAS